MKNIKIKVDEILQKLIHIFPDIISNWNYVFQPFHITENVTEQRQSDVVSVNDIQKRYLHHHTITLYDHTYGCPSLCSYCGFFTAYPPPNKKILSKQLDLKKKEQDIMLSKLGNIKIPALYFGGGTPTILPNDLLEDLVRSYKDKFPIDNDTEITVEANPQTITPGKLLLLRSLGVNRMSFGIQSLDQKVLHNCGRNYTIEKVQEVLDEAVRLFPYVNTDVIYGLKHQTLKNHLETLKKIVDCGVNQITAYPLWLEGTNKVTSDYATSTLKDYPSPMERIEMYLYTKFFLESVGFQETFVGWFSKTHQKVKIYDQRWNKQVPCIGIGCGSYSYSHELHYSTVRDWNLYSKYINAGNLPIKDIWLFTQREQQIVRLMWKIKSGGPFMLNEIEKEMISDFIYTGLIIQEGSTYHVSILGRTVNEFMISKIIKK